MLYSTFFSMLLPPLVSTLCPAPRRSFPCSAGSPNPTGLMQKAEPRAQSSALSSHPPSLPGAQEHWCRAQDHQEVIGQCVPVISIRNIDFLHITAPGSPSRLQWKREEGRQPLSAAPLLCTLTALPETQKPCSFFPTVCPLLARHSKCTPCPVFLGTNICAISQDPTVRLQELCPPVPDFYEMEMESQAAGN